MEARVKWLEHRTFVGISGSGHSVTMDGAPENGGRNLGFRPMEMLLLGLGGCSSFDVVSILQKSRQDISSCEAIVKAKRAEVEPKIFTDAHLHFVIKGKNLKEDTVKKAVDLSIEKYCSAGIMFSKSGTVLTHTFEIIEE